MNNWIRWTDEQPKVNSTVLVMLSEKCAGSSFHTMSRMKIANGYLDVVAGVMLHDLGADVVWWRDIKDVVGELWGT